MVKKVSIWLSLEPLISGDMKHISQIAKELNIPHTTVRKHLHYFETKGVVGKKIIGKQTFYYLKKSHSIVEHLVIVEKERTIRFMERNKVNKYIIEKLHELCKEGIVIIFGSYVEDEKNAEDIDILISGKYDNKKLKSLEKIINKKLHLTEVKSLQSIDNTLRKEILKKHIIVEGSEVAIKWMLINNGA